MLFNKNKVGLLVISFCITHNVMSMQEEKKEQSIQEVHTKMPSPKPFKKANSESTLDLAVDAKETEKKEDLRKSLHKSGSAPAGLIHCCNVWVSSPCGRTRDVETLPLQNQGNPESTNHYQDLFP